MTCQHCDQGIEYNRVWLHVTTGKRTCERSESEARPAAPRERVVSGPRSRWGEE